MGKSLFYIEVKRAEKEFPIFYFPISIKMWKSRNFASKMWKFCLPIYWQIFVYEWDKKLEDALYVKMSPKKIQKSFISLQ